MIAAAVLAAIAAVAALGLWIRHLYRQIENIPSLTATLKTATDRRDALVRELALERFDHAKSRAHIEKLSKQLAAMAAQQKENTDARIQEDPGDGGVQLRIADELLGRTWPGDDTAGADGDRQGVTGKALPSADAAKAAAHAGR